MPLDPMQPFTRAQGRAAGLTDRQLAGAAYTRLLGGVYLSAEVEVRPIHRARAALLVHPPSAVLSHSSVARLIGAPVPVDPVEHVTVPRDGDRRHRAGLRCHVADLSPQEVRATQGLRITSALRMFLDLAGTLPLVDLVVLGDWLAAKGILDPETLRSSCGRARHRHAAAARAAAAYVRSGVDSPMETRLRMLLVLAGLPEPRVNWELYDAFGVVLRRLDLAYPDVRVAVEYDGRHHVEVVEQWESDLARREGLEGDRWRMIVVTGRGIYREPGATVDRVRAALVARGLRLPPSRQDWRAHFPH